MVKLKHPKENPSPPLPGHYYASPLLPAHYRHCTHSNEPMENEHAHKQYCALWGMRGRTDDSAHDTTSSTHQDTDRKRPQ